METNFDLILNDSKRLYDFVVRIFESEDNEPIEDEYIPETFNYDEAPSTLRYYKVAVMCGHVGNRKYVRRDFGIVAKSKKEAIQKALKKGKTKKSRDDAVIHVYTIDHKEYVQLLKNIAKDPYKQSRDVQKLIRQGLLQDEIREIKKRRIRRECHETNLQYKRRKNELKYELAW